jgi:hypothetical protein
MRFRGTYANVVSTLALIIALSGGAYAATGGSLILGRSNSASSLTSVSNPRGVAFSFRSKTGSPPFTVSSNSVKVSSLNADKVDGLDATQLQGQTGPQGPAGPAGPQGPTGPQGEQGPAGLSGVHVDTSDVMWPDSGTAVVRTVTCPNAETALSFAMAAVTPGPNPPEGTFAAGALEFHMARPVLEGNRPIGYDILARVTSSQMKLRTQITCATTS